MIARVVWFFRWMAWAMEAVPPDPFLMREWERREPKRETNQRDVP